MRAASEALAAEPRGRFAHRHWEGPDVFPWVNPPSCSWYRLSAFAEWPRERSARTFIHGQTRIRAIRESGKPRELLPEIFQLRKFDRDNWVEVVALRLLRTELCRHRQYYSFCH
jgi:hypothetical protein